MGTSQSHNLKSGPNWSEAKRAITGIAKDTGDINVNCSKFMQGFSTAVSGSYGRSGSIGSAGSRTAKNFFDLISVAQTGGVNAILDLLQLQQERDVLTKESFIEKIIIYVTGEHDSTEDDDAAMIALENLLNDICSDCASIKEIVDKLQNASDDDKIDWIIRFEIDYILEYAGELFQSHILDKTDNPDRIISEIRNWMHRELDERLSEDLKPIDFSTVEGKEILSDLTKEILDIWKQQQQ